MKYETMHTLLTPDKQHEIGDVIEDTTFDKPETERLLRVGAIAPLKGTEGYEPVVLAPDQGTDPAPRGLSFDLTPIITTEELDAQIESLTRQREAVKKRESDTLAVQNAKRGPGRPKLVDFTPTGDNAPVGDTPPPPPA
jgi:hypothetical protein